MESERRLQLSNLLKKSNGCQSCHEFLTTNNYLEVNNDIGSEYSLIELVDRGSLKYPSPLVIESVSTLYEIFLKIDWCDRLNKEFYSGPSRSMLVEISMFVIAENFAWKDWCICDVSKWDILRKLCVTWSDIILSKRVRNFNLSVLNRDNTKLKKYH